MRKSNNKNANNEREREEIIDEINSFLGFEKERKGKIRNVFFKNIKTFIKNYNKYTKKLLLKSCYMNDFIHFLKQYFSYNFFKIINGCKIKNKHHYSEQGRLAEEEVSKLTSNLYFKNFCYLNPKNKSGGEIADLLIIFENIVIIISIKNVKMKMERVEIFTEINIPRKYLEKSENQLNGAERFLKNQNKLSLTNMNGEKCFINFSEKKYYKISMNFSLTEPARMSSGLDNEDVLHLSKKSFHFLLKYVSTVPELISYLQYKFDPKENLKHSIFLQTKTERDNISLWFDETLCQLEDEDGVDLFLGNFDDYEKDFSKKHNKEIDNINRKSDLFDRNIKLLAENNKITLEDLVAISKLKRLDRFDIVESFNESKIGIDAIKKHRFAILKWRNEDIVLFFAIYKNFFDDCQKNTMLFEQAGDNLYKENEKFVLGIIINLEKSDILFNSIKIFRSKSII